MNGVIAKPLNLTEVAQIVRGHNNLRHFLVGKQNEMFDGNWTAGAPAFLAHGCEEPLSLSNAHAVFQLA